MGILFESLGHAHDLCCLDSVCFACDAILLTDKGHENQYALTLF